MAFILDRESPRFCVVCRAHIPRGRIATGAFTCGDSVCHQAFVIRLERDYGKYKRVVDLARGKVFLVPTRDVVERGLKQRELWQYPSVEPTREEAIRFEADLLRSIGARPEVRDGVRGLVIEGRFIPAGATADVVICRRAKGVPKPLPGCIVRKCATCGEDVWIAAGGQAMLENNPKARIACMQCTEKELKALALEPNADKEKGHGGKESGPGRI